MSTVERRKPRTLPPLVHGQHLDQPTFHERYEAMPPQTRAELAGVLEYLVVELEPNRIHWFIRHGDRFKKLSPSPDGVYRSKVFPGLWLDPAAIFTRDRVRRDEVLEQGVQSPEHARFVARLA